MTAELILYTKGTETESGQMPWQRSERDNWYAFTADRPDGTTMGRAKRTAHAAEIGRAVLADLRAKSSTPVASVSVYEYDTDADTMPAATGDGRELVEVENRAALAVVTDPRPVGEAVEQFERDVEAARIAQRHYEAARARAFSSMRTAYAASDRLETSDPDHRSANALAAMVKGLASRPTVLKFLAVHEGEADL
jgi:hypothetical protein